MFLRLATLQKIFKPEFKANETDVKQQKLTSINQVKNLISLLISVDKKLKESTGEGFLNDKFIGEVKALSMQMLKSNLLSEFIQNTLKK